MPLFTGHINQLRQFLPLVINYTPDDLMPVLQATEGEVLNRFLGDALTEQIVALGAEADLSDSSRRHERRALHLARTAVAKIGLATFLPFAEVQIGDEGITVPASEARKPAFEYQTNKLADTLLEAGWRAVDELITLVASQPATFEAWEDSPYVDEYEDANFKSPADFSQYYPIQDRWLTFWALRPFIRSTEESWGEPARQRIDALPGTVTDAQKNRLEKRLLRALAYQSVITALPSLSIELKGVNVQVNYASQFGNARYYQTPAKDHLIWVLQNLNAQADLAWQTFNAELLELTSTDNTDAGMGLPEFDGPFTFL